MRTQLPALILVLGLCALYPLQQWVESTTPRPAARDESLYLSSGPAIKKMSLGLDGLMADIYWIRTVQYFGRKVLESDQPININDLSNIPMENLAPLLNIVVELDPQHIGAYRFGAIFLPERDVDAAIALLNHGIEKNPDEWRLYQDLGYIYWQKGDYLSAAEIYDRGGAIPGSMPAFRDLSGLMRIKGGSRQAARAIYEGYENDDDPKVRGQAIARLKQLRALDEIDWMNELLAGYRKQLGVCPSSLRVLAPRLRSLGILLNEDLLPVDPDGFPYVLNHEECNTSLSADSRIPL